jgi:hypothetical protein
MIDKDKGLIDKDKGLIDKDKGLIDKDKGLIDKDKGLKPLAPKTSCPRSLAGLLLGNAVKRATPLQDIFGG